MTAHEVRELIGQVEASGLSGGVVLMPKPATPYDRKRIELYPGIEGREIGIQGHRLYVLVPLANLYRMLNVLGAE